MNLRKNSQLTVVNNLPCTMPCTSVSMCIAHASGMHKAGVGTTGLVELFNVLFLLCLGFYCRATSLLPSQLPAIGCVQHLGLHSTPPNTCCKGQATLPRNVFSPFLS